jgi:uncharacterized protein YbjQ (UPF0145 family)
MKRILLIFFALIGADFLFAQDGVGAPAAADTAAGVPQQSLSEVSIDKFEMEGFWRSDISTDAGFTVSRLFEGGPSNKTPIAGEADLNIPDNKVLGTKVDFLRRGHTSIYVLATRPIPIEGLVKTISVWVAGRNYNHRLTLLIQDFYGRNFEIYMGRLNFQGWKNMTAVVPPQQELGMNGIVQQNFHYSNISGIKVSGFRIDCDPMEAVGTYFVYFDDLRAVTDLFTEDLRDPDDPMDDW